MSTYFINVMKTILLVGNVDPALNFLQKSSAKDILIPFLCIVVI